MAQHKVTLKPIYFLHEGYVESKNDRQKHFVSCQKLKTLYRIPSRANTIHVKEDEVGDYLLWKTTGHCYPVGIKQTPGDVHLYPKYDGNYVI